MGYGTVVLGNVPTCNLHSPYTRGLHVLLLVLMWLAPSGIY